MRSALLVALALALAACGVERQQSAPAANAARPQATLTTSTIPAAHPQVVEPQAGAAPASPAASAAGVAAAPPAEVSVSGGNPSLSQPVSDATVRQELAASGMTANSSQATLTPDGLAVPPVDAPPAVQEIIQAGNEIAHLPYVWGGGHVTYEDTGYDCSGSISFVFQAAHLISSPVVSGELMSWGAAGPGKWITIFANGGHTFMYVAGLRFDTVALARTGSRWSNRAPEENVRSFAVRHPFGL